MASDSQKKLGPIAILTVPLFIVALVFTVVLTGSTANCGPSGSGSSVSVDPDSVPDINIGGYGHAQLVNAAHIITAGKDLGLNARDQTIGVMTAMGESSLTNIDYGDWETGGVTNPDGSATSSIGLFQQQDGWGTAAERMDPYKSATMFFEAMLRNVPEAERESLAPTIVAHRTQINADPYHYEKYWDTAVQIVEELSGKTTQLGAGGATCKDDTTPGHVGKDGWASPGDGPINDRYGPRAAIPGVIGAGFHTGLDLEAGGCYGPIWAAHDGTVSNVFIDSLGNWFLVVDHGGGVITHYVHMYADGLIAKTGDKVKAGEQIARTGSSGASSGCHLHFEVQIDGEFTDPEPFLAERGITY
ncbi:M23 family metallopeptidase [Leucobacter massiliensis]|uniref:Peptidase M23 n=1 Tax=Leucobacter massiliensis TaxID=1686285 RepID=A0A2S9QSG0_9MICO|nr:M23 family metallopeptidase [Leucobacter massiliensis]PRI12508.1 peptidase M23 [Leucobacter massiliensis]